MFDALTSQLLRSAPSLPELDANQIPQLLTRHYAELVSARLKGEDQVAAGEDHWSLERIADAYEIVASVEETTTSGPTTSSRTAPTMEGSSACST
jgi:hypothetical protein